MLDDRAIFWLQALVQPLNFLWCSTFCVSGQFCWLSYCRSMMNWILSKQWWSTLSSQYWHSWSRLYTPALPNHRWQIYLEVPLGHLWQRHCVHPRWNPLPSVDQPANLTFQPPVAIFGLYFHSNPLNLTVSSSPFIIIFNKDDLWCHRQLHWAVWFLLSMSTGY